MRSMMMLLVFALGCGSATPTPVEPALQVVPLRLAMEGGERVQFARVALPAGQVSTLRGGACRDVLVYLVSGSLSVQGEDFPLRPGDGARLTLATRIEAHTDVDAIVVYVFDPAGGVAARSSVDAPGCTQQPAEPVVRCDYGALPVHHAAGGKLHVRILFDHENGARLAAMSTLDGAADLGVPEHVHEGSVEALYIFEGQATMRIGERELSVGPNTVAYVPPNTLHDLRPTGASPLRALQIYAGPGPEQRFRQAPSDIAPMEPAPMEPAQEDAP